MKKTARLSVLMVLVALLALSLSSWPQVSAAEEAVPLRIMTDFWVATIPTPDWPEWKAVEKRLGIKLQMEFNMNFSPERIATAVASGNMPDAILINLLATPAAYDWINQGAFQPVAPNLRKYAPHLWKELAPGAIQLGSVNGVLYGVPRPRATARECFALRKDWLDKLKLAVPKTTDELENVLKAFVTKDPDGNGKNDTYGFSGQDFNTLMVPFLGTGNPYQFVYDAQGRVQYNGISDEAKEGLAMLRRWYQEGLIDPDMVTQPGKFIRTAKVGLITPWLDQLRPSEYNPVPENWQQMRLMDPKAQWVMVPMFASPGFKAPKHYQNAGTSSHFFVSARLKDPKKIEKLFKWWDFWASKAGYDFGSWGIKNVDYVVDAGGKRTLTAEGKNRMYAMQCFRQTHLWEAQMQVAADKPAINAVMSKMLKQLTANTTPNPFIDVAGRSKVYLQYWPELYRKQQEAYTQIMIGAQPVEYFNTFAKEWRQMGGDAVLQDMNRIYKK